jgi:hypothetical protein
MISPVIILAIALILTGIAAFTWLYIRKLKRLLRRQSSYSSPSAYRVREVTGGTRQSPAIVFVTTCKGRAQHVEQTLPRNLADNSNPNSRFVLLDYASDDHLIPYLKSHHLETIASGKLVIYSFPTSGPFQMGHAKNMAARLGILEGAELLVTLDADNFTGPNFDQFVARQFEENGIFLCPDHHGIRNSPWPRPARGYAGRLAVRSQDFLKAGAYNEVYNTWGGEDVDFVGRMLRMGYNERHIDNCYLRTIPHNAEVRFKEYPHARQYEKNDNEWKIVAQRTDTIVNYGKFGIGTVYKNFGHMPIKLSEVPTRVFGIGMHKTATSSLHKAFQILGFDSFHWGMGEAPLIWDEMNAAGKSKTLERWYALCDLPIPLLYQQLDKGYPGSKFILTIRNEAGWLKSVERLWDARYNPTRWEWNVYPFTNRIHRELYGTKDFNSTVMLERYRRHNAEVIAYFKSKPEQLLIMDMDAGANWPELCRFLNMPIPAMAYPKEWVTKLQEGTQCSM